MREKESSSSACSGKDYMAIQAEAEANLRQLLDIPDNYKVLFLQGGASTQFAAIPVRHFDSYHHYHYHYHDDDDDLVVVIILFHISSFF